MATDYDKLTREELVEALGHMKRGYARLTAKAEEDGQLIGALERQLRLARTGELEQARKARDSNRLKGITLEVSVSLAQAWTDMIEYLRE